MRKNANREEWRAWFIKWGLYVNAMEFLFVLVFIQTVKFPTIDFAWSERWLFALLKDNILPTFCALIILFCVLFKKYFNYFTSGSEENRRVISVDKYESNIMVFLSSYILPLASYGDLGISCRMVFSAVALFVIGKMCVDSEWLAANPTLFVLGYKVYKIRLGDREEIVISRKEIKAGETIAPTKLNATVSCW